MPSQNIECQLAQGQIGRYLNGDRFSPEAVKQLESHIAECDECTQLLAKRREAVIAMLGGQTHAAVRMEVPSPAATAAVKLLKAITKGDGPVEVSGGPAAPSRKHKVLASLFPKPVLYCAGLAAVLMVMSYFSHGASKLFGPTAVQALPADAPLGKPAPVPTPTPKSPALARQAGPVKPAPLSKPIKPKVLSTPAQARRANVRQTKPRVHIVVHRVPAHPAGNRSRTAVRSRLSRRHAAPHSAGIRVYDPSGHPIR